MLHLSDLLEYAQRFLHHADQDGRIPEHGDHWSRMNYDHGEQNPDEPGITAEERQRRVDYLNETWWPSVIANVNEQKEELANLPGGNPIEKWRKIAKEHPRNAHGFEVD